MLHVRIVVHVNQCACVRVRLCVNVKRGCFFFLSRCFMYLSTKSKSEKKKKVWIAHICSCGLCGLKRRLNEGADENAQRYTVYAVSNHQSAAHLLLPPAAGSLRFCTTITFPLDLLGF